MGLTDTLRKAALWGLAGVADRPNKNKRGSRPKWENKESCPKGQNRETKSKHGYKGSLSWGQTGKLGENKQQETWLEMKNTLEGINHRLEEAEGPVSDLEDKVAENHPKQQKSLSDLAQEEDSTL